jgi:hypothetical protein
MILATFLAVCTQHLKYFPLSAFPMYAAVGTQSVVRYLHVVGITASGEIVEIHLDDEIGALADGRSKRFLKEAFSRRVHILNQLLETWGGLYNADRAMEDHIVEVVVTRKRWDYELESRGRVFQRYVCRLRGKL